MLPHVPLRAAKVVPQDPGGACSVVTAGQPPHRTDNGSGRRYDADPGSTLPGAPKTARGGTALPSTGGDTRIVALVGLALLGVGPVTEVASRQVGTATTSRDQRIPAC